MRKLFLFVLLIANGAFAQNTYKAVIKDKSTKETLVGATAVLKGTTNGSSADINGMVAINNIPNGKQLIEFTFLGYENRIDSIIFPLSKDTIFTIYLSTGDNELEEIVVTSSTRSSRNIADIPTRIETISGGELEEKSVMQPGNIKMLLTESTGIQTQQTSQVSASSGIRIQGLDGKYTLLLQ